jgi:hypothetical protein
MVIHNVEQWTEEWFEVRKMKMTASHATAIGNAKKWLETYIIGMMAEYYSTWERDEIQNRHIDRWNEVEPLARSMYELENDCIIREVWFCEMSEYVWCSPDGLVWDDWGIEIKCMNDVKHLKLLLDWIDWIDPWHIRQIQMCLLVTWRKWRDYVAFNPNLKHSMIVHRISPDEEKHEQLRKWFELWEQQIKSIIEKLGK